ncbi:MAG TPA: decaprenyl-phosphate phosphoribosyltransferase [Thermoflexales bacterium]|nr:decaprenyl-phosphate phosphoribosyltransferase [Thermoflexales bacterium]HQW34802.1 decaprenyl-phosphate phosphoribosyltransferase [Thermoflexales bacterium]HQX76386.1 decaprenyl-phosphate phosphoribosyltransferase [Thermoflexales bacterium]HQZ22689.1 decaprenyl-phosphate phosphoribosyltransferase [Thermoflexales bacterium]HRA01217.1 decaprenyl-phosphate phosphoribosyltransferase [Thermoflexales bacterium]
MDNGTSTSDSSFNAVNALRGLIKTMRPKQWIKNLFIFAALVFDGKLLNLSYFTATLIGFGAFCLISSSVYLINDIADVNADRQHPKKKNRAIPRGDLPIPLAWAAAGAITLIALGVGFTLNTGFGLVLLAYFALMLAYTFKLKHMVILDVLLIAVGFVLRVGAGVPLVDAERFSPWMFVCMFLLAMLLGFGKRRQEIVELGGGNATRAILDEYNIELLDQIIAIVTGGVIVAYAFYTFSSPAIPDNHAMMASIPFVVYGLFRYLYLVHVKGQGGAPDEIALTDRPMQVDIILWGLVVVAAFYGPKFLGK